MKDFFTKALYFFGCVLFVFATIGSTAYLFYYDKPQFAISSLVVSFMALPALKEYIKSLNGKE